MGETGRFILALGALAAVTGCSGLRPGERTTSCADSRQEQSIFDPKTGEYSISFEVMTYNVEGLLRPFKEDRGKKIEKIKEIINLMLKDGDAPDILVVQEMFTVDAIRHLRALRYPNFIYGPTRGDAKKPLPMVRLAGFALPNITIYSSGLAIFSRYPITGLNRRAFGYTSCSGADCFANKGMVAANIAIPGVPVPLRVATTHMNAQDVSGTPEGVHLHAHRQQSEELADFLNDFDDDAPMMIAGDFNMRGSPSRYAHFSKVIPHQSAHHYCYQNPGICRALIPLPKPAPWLTTQDLQFFKDGRAAKLRPVRLSTWFDSKNGDVLSDHPAQRVRWKLIWPAHMQPISGSCDHKAAPALEDLFG